MNEIKLTSLELKTFTEQNASDYCQINNINPDNITVLDLFNNELTDISGIKLFKNLKELYINYNKIKDISVIKNLMFPSSSKRISPTFSSSISPGYVVQIILSLPIMSSDVICIDAPSSRVINPFSSFPTLIFGPCKS